MKIFIDTADVEAIRRAKAMGFVSGVTTNPSLIAAEGKDFHTVIKEIASIVDGPVSAEVLSETAEEMIAEGQVLDVLVTVRGKSHFRVEMRVAPFGVHIRHRAETAKIVKTHVLGQ